MNEVVTIGVRLRRVPPRARRLGVRIRRSERSGSQRISRIHTRWRSIDAEEWRHDTLCDGWDVEDVVAHLVAAASLNQWQRVRSHHREESSEENDQPLETA